MFDKVQNVSGIQFNIQFTKPLGCQTKLPKQNMALLYKTYSIKMLFQCLILGFVSLSVIQAKTA